MAIDQKNEKDTQGKKKSGEKRGFYIALAVCLAAVGIAAWSTYDTVSGFLEPVSSGDSGVSSTVSSSSAAATARPTPEADAPAGEDAAESSAAETAAQPEYTVSVGYTRPVESEEILLAYSEDPVYSETMRDYRAHMGVDYAAAHGETVKAVANGLVKETYTDMLLGNTIVIEHGAYEVRYCGLGETFLVEPGEIVSAGQDIGSVTAAPFESAMDAHLHLEATEDGVPFNPENLFG